MEEFVTCKRTRTWAQRSPPAAVLCYLSKGLTHSPPASVRGVKQERLNL